MHYEVLEPAFWRDTDNFFPRRFKQSYSLRRFVLTDDRHRRRRRNCFGLLRRSGESKQPRNFDQRRPRHKFRPPFRSRFKRSEKIAAASASASAAFRSNVRNFSVQPFQQRLPVIFFRLLNKTVIRSSIFRCVG